MSKIIIKNELEIAKMREAGACAAWVLEQVKKAVAPGISTYELDQLAKKAMDSCGATSSAYGYGFEGNRFPAYICISVNEQVVHGIGKKDKILREGDIVSLDVALSYNGFVGDNTYTLGVGKISPAHESLLKVTEQSLYKGIEQACEGNRVGRDMHEEPQVPNVGMPHKGPLLKAGMIIAIEPMLTLGSPKIETLADGWTIVTRDKQYCAHFEHTVLITKDLPEILTIVKK